MREETVSQLHKTWEDAGKIAPSRQYGLDLLRILSMMMVVSLHLLGKGGFLEGLKGPMGTRDYLAFLLESFSVVAVNVYVLISGYFLCQKTFRTERLVKLWLQTFFYSFGIFVLMWAAGKVTREDLTIHDLLTFILPITMDHYWFLRAYFIMVLFSPVLNLAVRHLTQKQHLRVLLLLILLFCIPKSFLPVRLEMDDKGYSGLWFLVVYLMAAYIRRRLSNGKKEKTEKGRRPRIPALCYMLGAFGIFGWILLYHGIDMATGRLDRIQNIALEYNHIANLFASVSLFLTFALMKQDKWPKGLKKVITFLAPYTLGVYLLHEHLLVRYQWPLWLGSQRVQGAWDLLVFWILGILCVFTVGVVTDFVRDRLFRLMACLPPIKALGGLIRKADGIFASRAEDLQKAVPDEEDKKNVKSDGSLRGSL